MHRHTAGPLAPATRTGDIVESMVVHNRSRTPQLKAR